jgi:hypothetical protein
LDPTDLRERKHWHILETGLPIRDIHRAFVLGKLPVQEIMERLMHRFTKRTGIELTVPIKN